MRLFDVEQEREIVQVPPTTDSTFEAYRATGRWRFHFKFFGHTVYTTGWLKPVDTEVDDATR
jgi:hypothetical protein